MYLQFIMQAWYLQKNICSIALHTYEFKCFAANSSGKDFNKGYFGIFGGDFSKLFFTRV